MAHHNNPRSQRAVDACQIGLEPLVLLIGLVVIDATINTTKWAAVGNVGLALLRESLVAAKIASEWVFGALGEIGLTVKSDEVCQSVIERVPEVANTTSQITRAPETILVSSEVPRLRKISTARRQQKIFIYLWEGGQL